MNWSAINIKRNIRYSDWWDFIIPPLLTFAYIKIYLADLSIAKSLVIYGLIFISSIGTAIFGFFVNDLADFDSDLKAGKKNFTSSFSKTQKTLIIIAALISGIVPWLIIKPSIYSWAFIIMQFTLLAAYSLPPIRLKKNKYASVFCDALYSGLLFILAIVMSDCSIYSSIHYPAVLLFCIIIAYFIRGLRNILLHQIADFEADKATKLRTVANTFGIPKVQNFISHFLFPVELLSLVVISLLLSYRFEYFILILIVFLGYFIFKVFDTKKAEEKKSFLYIINDFYEDIFPLSILIYLVFLDTEFVIFLMIHLIAFKNKFIYFLYYNVIFIFIYKRILLYIYFKVLVIFYHRVIVWIYYKAFCNKYITRFYSFFLRKHN